MMLITLNVLACCLIFLWSCWAVVGNMVNDGVLGKAIWSGAALAALSVILGNVTGYSAPNPPDTTLHLFIAALGMRHMFLKHVWPKIMHCWRCKNWEPKE